MMHSIYKVKNYIVVYLFFLLVFTSCTLEPNKPKIGFLIRGFEIARCTQEKDFFTERMNQLGGEPIVVDGREDDKLQIEQAIEMMDNGVKVIVIFPVNLVTAAAIVRKANERKVKVIAYESLIMGCDYDYFVSNDNGKGGELMAEYIIKQIPNGNYILIGGDYADRNAILIKEAQRKIFDPVTKAGNIKILYDIYADWSADEGYQNTKYFINLSGIMPDAIISSNDGMAAGVIKALEEYGTAGKVAVTGLDAELSACQRIAKGTQTLTIYKSFKEQAYLAAEMAYKMALGQKPDKVNTYTENGLIKVPSYLIAPVLVDKNNLKQIIVEGKVYSQKDVYGE